MTEPIGNILDDSVAQAIQGFVCDIPLTDFQYCDIQGLDENNSFSQNYETFEEPYTTETPDTSVFTNYFPDFTQPTPETFIESNCPMNADGMYAILLFCN